MELSAVVCIDTPIGQVAIGSTPRGVAEVTILRSGERRAEFIISEQAACHTRDAAEQLNNFFSATSSSFTVPLDLRGTAFQLAVWGAISKLPRGQAMSYGELAAAVGKPLAARAVGRAVGSNPVPLIIGCHRILGSSKTLTGYSGGGGLDTKRWLLDFEKIEYRP